MDARSYTGEQAPKWAQELLRQFGITPVGESVYRVVRSDGRFMIAYDEWVPVYPNLEPQWVLEKWLSCDEFTGGMDRVQWAQQNYDVESNTMILGPLPTEGDYEFCFAFGVHVPLSDEVLRKVSRVIHDGKAYTMSQRRAAIREREARKQAELAQRISDVVDDAQDSGTRDAGWTGFGGKSNAKRAEDVRVDMTHEQLMRKNPGLGKRGGKQLMH